MAELVDAHVSGACIERCAGSSPVPGTKEKTDLRSSLFLFWSSEGFCEGLIEVSSLSSC